MIMRGAENRPDADASAGRRDEISLHSAATTAAVARDAERREDVTMKVMLLQLIDVISAFNLAFITVTETAAAS
ncbi:hypothetical protein BDFG_08801 [Blastomyces dermatitidis ATCC 26199]|nr:hypothetical protein BDFG_08801 [Blastomyces dermatitidis ATCC 26199]